MSTCPDCESPDCEKKRGPIFAIRCDVRTIALLRQKLAASERETKLYRKGYEARGKILAAYRTGGRPSAKALDDAAEVASLLDKECG